MTAAAAAGMNAMTFVSKGNAMTRGGDCGTLVRLITDGAARVGDDHDATSVSGEDTSLTWRAGVVDGDAGARAP